MKNTINMKKVMTVLVMMVISLSAFSQTVINTNYNRVGTWDALAEKWSYGEWQSNDITFTSTATGISVSDDSKSLYTFISEREKTTGKTNDGSSYTSYRWNCLDEKGRNCRFIIVIYNKKDFKVSVMYDDIVINYTIK
jgi:hypothetical protein